MPTWSAYPVNPTDIMLGMCESHVQVSQASQTSIHVNMLMYCVHA